MNTLTSILKAAAFLLVMALVVGFALFVREARSLEASNAAETADALVVLTGGPNRVATAVTLLRDGRGERLLISGVNPVSPVSDIAAAAGAPESLFECCVDIGSDALDTVGNARETAQWARAGNYSTLILVTSDYHMPRALIEMRSALPEVEIVAHVVSAPAPWSGAGPARRWLIEYFKFVAVYARDAFTSQPAESDS